MSSDNVEAVRGVYERWSVGDFRASLEIVDPHLVFVMGSGFPDAGAYLGLDGLAKYTRGFLEPWARITIEATEIEAVGDSVVAAVCQRGVGDGSGVVTEFSYFHVWSFRGPRAIRLETFREREQALEAVGVGTGAEPQR